jgi:hypothetical protein
MTTPRLKRLHVPTSMLRMLRRGDNYSDFDALLQLVQTCIRNGYTPLFTEYDISRNGYLIELHCDGWPETRDGEVVAEAIPQMRVVDGVITDLKLVDWEDSNSRHGRADIICETVRTDHAIVDRMAARIRELEDALALDALIETVEGDKREGKF